MLQTCRSLLFLLVWMCFGGTASVALAGEPLEVGDMAPDWILPNTAGDHISFYEDSQGKPAVLLFWATWCPYCREVMPELASLRAELDADAVKFYALNIWEDDDPAAYLERNSLPFDLLLKADMVAKRYGVQGTPGLMVIDANKTVSYIRLKGTSAEDARAAVKAALVAGGE